MPQDDCILMFLTTNLFYKANIKKGCKTTVKVG